MAPNESAFKLTSAFRRGSGEAMITTRSDLRARRSGRAESPSSSGMSMSSMTTSGLSLRTLSTASQPLRNVPTTSIPDSSESHRDIRPRTTTASSTIMTRMACPAVLLGAICGKDMILNRNSTHRTRHGTSLPPNGGRKSSDQADFLEFRFDDFLVEWLHDVFVGAGMHRTRDMREVVFGGAEDDLRLVAVRHGAERAQEFVAVHDRHVPIEENRFGHLLGARFERLTAVGRFHDGKAKSFEDSPSHLSDYARIVDYKTTFHCRGLLFTQQALGFSVRVRARRRGRPSGGRRAGRRHRPQATSAGRD